MDSESSSNARFEITNLPARHCAAIRHTGPYNQIGEAFTRLESWARKNQLFDAQRRPLTLGFYLDDPKSVEQEQLRSDACVEVPEDMELDAEVNTRDFPGGRFAVGHFTLGVGEFLPAWRETFTWVGTHGLLFDSDRLCYELYLQDCSMHPENKFVVSICIPIKS